eukprot:jgi/Ulvmu1/12239/UM086_0030.1
MRGGEDLERFRDSQVRDEDAQYISKHNIAELMRETMEALLIHRPTATIPFMIDCFSMGPRLASQDAHLGIAVWRKEALLRVFSHITQGQRNMDLLALKDYAGRGGSSTMSDDEMQDVFQSIKLHDDDHVTEDQFLHVFAITTADLQDTQFQMLMDQLSV